jgi:hypothetical protein
MTTLTSLARGLAAENGRATLIRTVRHVHVSARPLVFIPLQLAGEANAPLAALAGDDRGRPRLLAVSEPRNRAERFEFAAALGGEVIMPYLDGHATASLGEKEAYPDAPQILVPNLPGVAFTRLLGRSTRLRSTEGQWAVSPAVPLLGRWLTFYAERPEHPASSLLLPMTSALAAHWATGQSATEDQNLAALLGWIAPPPGKSARQAARDAEDPAQWPPAGPATDPGFDSRVLGDLVAAIRQARARGDDAAAARQRGALEAALLSQLEPTWRLMWQGVDLLRSLPAAAHVARRWESDRRAFTGQVAWIRDGGAPQARRDSAVAAARRLDRMERELRQVAVQMAYDDPLVMAEYRMSGQAFKGTVVYADPGRTVGEGRSRTLRPVIVVETADPLAIEAGEEVADPGRAKQKGLVLGQAASRAAVAAPSAFAAPAAFAVPAAAAPGDPGEQAGARAGDAARARVTLELSGGGMGRKPPAPPGSMPAVGDVVCYTSLTDEFQRPPEFPEREDTPWTHGGPPPQWSDNDEDAGEAWE